MMKMWSVFKSVLILGLTASNVSLASANDISSTQLDKASDVARKDTQLMWSTSMVGEQSSDALSNVKNEIELGLTIKFDMEISPWLSMNLTPKFVAQTGYIQAPDAIDPQGSRIDIRNASLDLRPVDSFTASVGSLDQRIFHSNIFMSARSFPAARVLGRWGSAQASNLYAFAETDIPTGNSVSNNSQDLGATPTLNTGGIGFRTGDDHSSVQTKGFVNAFEFSGLSQDLSTSSVILGNTGVNNSGSNYLFKYNYVGFEANLEAAFQVARPAMFEIWGRGVQNTQAPSGMNLGWLAGTGFKYDFSNKLQIEPKFEYYHMESDSTVAVYNDMALNTNREGYRTEMRFFYNHRVQMYVQYGTRVPLVLNPTQPAETWYLLGVETENAKF